MNKKISIIIAVKPGRKYDDALAAISSCDYRKGSIEVIIASGYQPSKQRNEAAKRASGDIIYFLDDDSIIDSASLAEASRQYQDEKVAGAGGPSISLSTDSFLQKIFAYVLTSRFGTFNLRSRYSRAGNTREAKEDDLILCNLSFQKGIFIKEAGFDERLYPNEENELFHRLTAKGCRMIYNPAMIVQRSQRKTIPDFISQIFIYGRGRMDQMFIRMSIVSLFRLVPLIFLLYVLSLPFSSNVLYFMPLFFYFALDMSFSSAGAIRLKDARALIVLPFIYLIMHLSYAEGLLWGMIKRVFKIKNIVKCADIDIKFIKNFGDA